MSVFFHGETEKAVVWRGKDL